MTNHTATTQQLLVGLACGQTPTAPTAHYVTGNPERRWFQKDQNKLGSCPKESEEDLLLEQCANM